MNRCETNKRIRMLLNITIMELAKRVGVSRTTIIKYETGLCKKPIVERVVELELDMAIEKCTEKGVKTACEILRSAREETR